MVKSNIKKFCKDYTRIENYGKAIADKSQIWVCHHRLGTHNSDGERRLVDIEAKELKALNMYFDRPPEELIFMTNAEHASLHGKDKPHSEEWNRKVSEAQKDKKRGPRSEETKQRIAETMKGRPKSEETKKKLSESHKDQVPWNKGKKLGSFSEDHRKKLAESHKGKHWKLVDGKRVWY